MTFNATWIEQCDVLDHGYVRLIEHWGSDERIIEAARMSTDKGFLGWGPVHVDGCTAINPDVESACTCTPKPGDERLLGYLYDHWHHTPFEMAGLTLEIQAPIFVFREWHRHRTQSYNELSSRYVPIPDVNYLPDFARLQMTSKTNKQAQALANVDELRQRQWLVELAKLYNQIEGFYQNGLSIGVPKEVARVCLPVGRYSRMRASANLRNWLAFLTLRLDPAAQWEIRCYAHAVAQFIELHYKRTYALFNNKRTEACVTIELYRAVKALLDAPHPDHFASRLGDEELAAVDRLKIEIKKIDDNIEARRLA